MLGTVISTYLQSRLPQKHNHQQLHWLLALTIPLVEILCWDLRSEMA